MYLFALLLEGTAQGETDIHTRSWTAADSVGVRVVRTRLGVFGSGFSDPTPIDARRAIRMSPDGRHFFFVTGWGDLARDCSVQRLQVFSVDTVRAALDRDDGTPPAPVRAITWCSGAANGSIGSAVMDAQWETGTTIIFRGVDDASREAVVDLYRLSVPTGSLERLTRPTLRSQERVLGMSEWASQGNVTVFAHTLSAQPLVPQPYPSVLMNADTELARLRRPALDLFFRLAVAWNGRTRAVADVAAISEIHISPDGRWAIANYVPIDRSIPDEWSRYAGAETPSMGDMPAGAHRIGAIDVRRARLADATHAPVCNAAYDAGDRTGGFSPRGSIGDEIDPDVIDWAGLLLGSTVYWSSDSRHAVFCSTLPEELAGQDWRTSAYLIDYLPESDEIRTIAPIVDRANGRRISRIEWAERGTAIRLYYRTLPSVPIFAGTLQGEDAGSRVLTLSGGTWRAGPVEGTQAEVAQSPTPAPPDPNVLLSNGVTISAVEDTNDPPNLFASLEGRRIALLPPDPALQGVWLASGQVVEWQEASGNTVQGTLYLPRDFSLASPPPVVIELTQGRAGRSFGFRPGGNTSTGFAGQALVAEGFAVLVVQQDSRDPRDREQEAPIMVSRIDAAISSLAARGLVDRDRVGLVGFSRTGWYAHYVVSHPGATTIRAAVVADSITGSYLEYVSDGASRPDSPNGIMQGFADTNGGQFWDNREAWLRHAVGFNIQNVRSPVLLTQSHLEAPLEIIAAYRITRRPFYAIAFPAGQYHQLQTPRERLESATATVDWMNFWILNKENADPVRAERNSHWREIRRRWEHTSSREEATRNRGIARDAR